MLNIGLKDVDGVSPDDITDLKLLESRLLPVEPALHAFWQLLDGLNHVIQHDELSKTLSPVATAEWAQQSSNYSKKVSAYMNNIRVLNRKCANTAQLLDQLFNFHNQRIARQQSSAVLFLTTKTVDDSATVRVITAITLVFLACTATAVSCRISTEIEEH